MKIDPVKIENITKTIVKQKYIANQNLIDRINSLHISDTIENKIMFDFLYSVGKMYFIANKNTENYLRKALKFTNTDREKIEINMMLGVEHLRNDEYDRADRHFMTCYPLQNDIHEILLDWPWKEKETVKLDITDRIDLYQFIIPYFSYIDTDDYFDFLAFQLRSNETVHLIRTGDHQTAHKYFEALFNYLPNLELDVIADIREKFREKRKHDMNIQVFDLATLHHYLGLSNWLISDFDKAILNFNESLYFREKKSFYLDLKETLVNIGTTKNICGDYWEATPYFETALKLINKSGNEKSIIVILLNLANSHQFMHEFEKAINYSEKALNISVRTDNIRFQAKSLENLGKTYQYMGRINDAIKFTIMGLEIRRKFGDYRALNYSIFNLIILFNRQKNITHSYSLLSEMEQNIYNNSLSANNKLEYLIAKIDLDFTNNNNLDRIKLDTLLDNIENNKITPELLNIALLLILKMDIYFGDQDIYLQIIVGRDKLIDKIKSNRQLYTTYYLIMKEMIYSNNIIPLDEYVNYLINELEITSSKKIMYEITEFIDLFTNTNIQYMNSFLQKIINDNFTYRYFELELLNY